MSAPSQSKRCALGMPLGCFVVFCVWVQVKAALPKGIRESEEAFSKDAATAMWTSPIPTRFSIPLRKESVPVKRHGKIVSYKTTYSGNIHVGHPVPQAFRVVFDTGSGYVVLPSIECETKTCLLHKRYDVALSEVAREINVDKTPINYDEPIDQVTIGYGTGKVVGGFVSERVCLGSSNGTFAERKMQRPCARLGVVTATDLSPNPFGLFPFDGICGLGMSGLALDPEFSFINMLRQSRILALPHFSVYLANDEEEMDTSELTFGGHKPERLAGPLQWAKVPMSERGHWQVEIVAVHIGEQTLELCKDGSCRGILDTGTSHLGIPSPVDRKVENMLAAAVDESQDCRLLEAPSIHIELHGFNLTLRPQDYMRKLPIREDEKVTAGKGATHPSLQPKAARKAVPNGPTASDADKGQNDLRSQVTHWLQGNERAFELKNYCRPRLMPVKLPAPLGPNLFILGEPILHRYYTVFDWGNPAVGFGLASHDKASTQVEITDTSEVFLMQHEVRVKDEQGEETTSLMQVMVIVDHRC